MPKRKQPVVEVAGESDSDSTKFNKTQKKMQKLRNEKEKEFDKVVAESRKELQAIGSQLEIERAKKRQESAKQQAKHITTLIDSMERRKQIEKEMQEVVAGVQQRIQDVEQMMLVGYDGRLAAMNKVFEKKR